MSETASYQPEEATGSSGLDSQTSPQLESDLQKMDRVQVEARVAALEPSVLPGEDTQAAIERHRGAQVDAARQTIAAVAQGDEATAARADFDRMAAEANANILSGSPDDLVTERPNITQAEAQRLVEQGEAGAVVPAPAEVPVQQSGAEVVDLAAVRAQRAEADDTGGEAAAQRATNQL